MDAIKEDIKV